MDYKSAVEWYIENVKLTEIEYLDDKITTTELDVIIDNLGEQAKEMEKQQQGYSEEEVLELIQFLSDEEDFKENSSISIFIAEDYLNKFKNK